MSGKKVCSISCTASTNVDVFVQFFGNDPVDTSGNRNMADCSTPASTLLSDGDVILTSENVTFQHV